MSQSFNSVGAMIRTVPVISTLYKIGAVVKQDLFESNPPLTMVETAIAWADVSYSFVAILSH